MLLKEKIRELMLARIEEKVEELVDEATVEDAILDAMDLMSFDAMIETKIEDVLFNYDYEPIVEDMAETILDEEVVDSAVFEAVAEKIDRIMNCPF